jgi:hypothetical protein
VSTRTPRKCGPCRRGLPAVEDPTCVIVSARPAITISRWPGERSSSSSDGYPVGLAGEEIPLVARIVCTCDVWSAMTTDRSYRRALSRDAAIAELRNCAGTQFDPRVVEALLGALAA